MPFTTTGVGSVGQSFSLCHPAIVYIEPHVRVMPVQIFFDCTEREDGPLRFFFDCSERRQDPGEGEMPVAWSVAVEEGRVAFPAPCTLTGDGSGGQSFPLCHH